MRAPDVLDDLLDSGQVVVDERSRAVCARCGLPLGPIAAVGLVIEQAIAHLCIEELGPTR